MEKELGYGKWLVDKRGLTLPGRSFAPVPHRNGDERGTCLKHPPTRVQALVGGRDETLVYNSDSPAVGTRGHGDVHCCCDPANVDCFGQISVNVTPFPVLCGSMLGD
jgi:hypothetical protein